MKRFKAVLISVVAMAVAMIIQAVVGGIPLAIIMTKSIMSGIFIEDPEILLSKSINLVFLFLIISGLISLILYGLWYYKKLAKKNKPSIKKSCKGGVIIWIVLLAVGLQVATAFIMTLITPLFPKMFEQYSQQVLLGLNQLTIVSFIFIVIIAPLSEEYIFRGVILNVAKKGFPFIYANIIQAILFGIMHGNIIQGIYTFIIGLFLGLVYEKRQSIFPPIVLHLVFNLSGILLGFLPESIFDGREYLMIIPVVVGIGIIVLSTVKLMENPMELVEDELEDVKVEENLIVEMDH